MGTKSGTKNVRERLVLLTGSAAFGHGLGTVPERPLAAPARRRHLGRKSRRPAGCPEAGRAGRPPGLSAPQRRRTPRANVVSSAGALVSSASHTGLPRLSGSARSWVHMALVAAWVAFEPRVDTSRDSVEALKHLSDVSTSVGLAVGISFAAYLLGSVSEYFNERMASFRLAASDIGGSTRWH